MHISHRLLFSSEGPLRGDDVRGCAAAAEPGPEDPAPDDRGALFPGSDGRRLDRRPCCHSRRGVQISTRKGATRLSSSSNDSFRGVTRRSAVFFAASFCSGVSSTSIVGFVFIVFSLWAGSKVGGIVAPLEAPRRASL